MPLAEELDETEDEGGGIVLNVEYACFDELVDLLFLVKVLFVFEA